MQTNGARRFVERVGHGTVHSIEAVGHGGAILLESIYWLLLGRWRKQPVRISSVFSQMMDIGIHAIPIVTVLATTIGVMLAIQGIYTLKTFGAESQVVFGIAFSVVREFSPLITGILVAGRSGSALAARLGTMTINEEIDALKVMAITPVRFLVVPALVAMVIMLPALTFYSELISLFAAGLYVSMDLGMSLTAYADQVLNAIALHDLMHGLTKSALFAILITLVAVVNGAGVTGGAEGVGRVTTRSVVHAITAIVLTDMLFAFIATRG